MSRTMRFIFLNVPPIGTMRKDITPSCSSSFSLCSWRAAFAKFDNSSPARSGFCVTIDSAMTSSPTRSIRRSSLSTRTEIICDSCSLSPPRALGGAGRGFGSGGGGTTGVEASDASMTACCCGVGQYSHSAVLASSWKSSLSRKIVSSRNAFAASIARSVWNQMRKPMSLIVSTACGSSRIFSGR